MRYLLIILVFFTSCGEDLVLPTVCEQGDLPNVEDKSFCSDSLKCITGNSSVTTKYLCTCDKLCICFFNKSSCLDKDCTSNGSMAILKGNFCLTNSTDRSLALEKMQSQIDDVKATNES